MRNALTILLSVFLLAAIAVTNGCWSWRYGAKQIASDEALAQIEKGKSTKAEVKELLGDPGNVSFMGDDEMWHYMLHTAEVRKSTFIPIVGGFVGGTDVETQTLTVLFGPDGVVKECDIVRDGGESEILGHELHVVLHLVRQINVDRGSHGGITLQLYHDI